MHTITVVIRLLILAWCVAGPVTVAQSLAIGKALFVRNCSACHGLPPSVIRGADAAAGDFTAILDALGRVGPMVDLRTRISELDARDIAAYLAQPQVPATEARSEVERIFNWAEWRYQSLLRPRAPSFRIEPYEVRFYADTSLYVGMAGDRVYLYDPAREALGIQDLGLMASFLTLAEADGF